MMAQEAKSLDIIVGGDLFIDLIMSGFPAWPQPGTEAFAREFHREVGGGAAISACGFAILGSRVAVLGVVGHVRRVAGRPLESSGRGHIAASLRPWSSRPRSPSLSAPRATAAFLTYHGPNRASSLRCLPKKRLLAVRRRTALPPDRAPDLAPPPDSSPSIRAWAAPSRSTWAGMRTGWPIRALSRFFR